MVWVVVIFCQVTYAVKLYIAKDYSASGFLQVWSQPAGFGRGVIEVTGYVAGGPTWDSGALGDPPTSPGIDWRCPRLSRRVWVIAK